MDKRNNETLECQCYSAENKFILAQFYFDRNNFQKAFLLFDEIKEKHKPSLYQLSVILYDDLLEVINNNNNKNK